MKTYQFDVNVIFEMNDIIEIQAKDEEEAYEKATEHMNWSGYDPTTDELQEISRQITASQCLDDSEGGEE